VAILRHESKSQPEELFAYKQMHLAPTTLEELTSSLAKGHAEGSKLESLDLNALHTVLEHKAEDMTATVQAGITLKNFQQQLASQGQWLPIDPHEPHALTIRAILETNASGPRRFGYGTIRDYVIGMTVALADGRLIHSGGKVVKNVAGYDLMKLFIGSRGSLGIIVEVTFKVLPLPESEQFAEARCESLDEAHKLLESIFDSQLAPKVLDLHNLNSGKSGFWVILGFAGTQAEVEWQLTEARQLGVNQPSSLDYDKNFFTSTTAYNKESVLPSKLIELLKGLNNVPFLARAGNGIVYHSGSLNARTGQRITKLEARLKREFDPKQIFPSF